MIHVAPATKTILFIEDNAQHRQQWGEGIKQLSPHYVLLEAVDGKSGLDVCRRTKVDCVILDLDLPDISGFEAWPVRAFGSVSVNCTGTGRSIGMESHSQPLFM